MARRKYFDNEAVTEAILKYKEGLEAGRNDIHLLHPYTSQIQQLIRGVINTHKIYRWWDDVDELVQEAMVAIYNSFQRFDPTKGTAFNYLSIVAKQHLKNWTQTRNRKNWNTNEFNDEIYVSTIPHSTEDQMVLEDLFGEVDVPNELESTLVRVMSCIHDEKLYNKRDIVKWMVREGWDKKDVDEVFVYLVAHFGELNDRYNTQE